MKTKGEIRYLCCQMWVVIGGGEGWRGRYWRVGWMGDWSCEVGGRSWRQTLRKR